MNYIKELNAFKNWVLLCELPTSAIVLWHTLMTINNGTYWKREFNAPNAVVRQLSGLSKQGLLTARAHLIEHGRIRCQKGKKGQAPIYEMVPFEPIEDSFASSSTSDLGNLYHDQKHASSNNSSNGQYDTETMPIHKQKQKKKQDSSRAGASDHLISLYEANIGKLRPYAADLLQAWGIELGEAVVRAAIELAVKRGGQTFRYVEMILREWARADIKTLEDVDAFEEARRAQRSNTVSFPVRQPEDKAVFFKNLREEGALS